ncbi:hypothetical protein H1C71_019247, partial [Ictidomys tridecemlineatus]
FFFSFNTENISLHSLICMVSEEKSNVIMIFSTVWVELPHSFPSGFYQDFLFVFDFLKFEYYTNRYRFGGIYPAWYSSNILDLFCCLSLMLGNFVVITSNSSCLFSFPSVFP